MSFGIYHPRMDFALWVLHRAQDLETYHAAVAEIWKIHMELQPHPKTPADRNQLTIEEVYGSIEIK